MGTFCFCNKRGYFTITFPDAKAECPHFLPSRRELRDIHELGDIQLLQCERYKRTA